MSVLAGKLIMGLLLLVILVVSFKLNLSRIKNRQFTFISWTTLIILRAAVFVGLFLVLKFVPQSDNIGYYSEAQNALAGRILYRDFESSYGPLFTYMDAAAVWLWNSPKSIVLLSIIVEIAFFPLWLYVARLSFGEKVARASSLLYIMSPLPLFVIAVNGQNQSFGAAYLVLVIYLLLKGRDAWAGFIMGLSIPGVKFLMGLFAPVTWATAPHRLKFFTTFFIPLLFFSGALWLKGADLTIPLQIQGNDQTPGNLPFLVGLLGFNSGSNMAMRLFDLFTLTALAIVFLIHLLRKRTSQLSWPICLCTIVGLTFMLCSKKSYTNYLVLFYFPLCISVAAANLSSIAVALFGVFNLVAAMEPSLYFRWILPSSGATAPSLAFASAAHQNPAYITATFLVCDIFLVSCYSFYFLRTWKLLDHVESRISRANIA